MDDLISRKALLETSWVLPNRMTREVALECFRNILSETPTIDAEPVRHGRWVDDDCSVCGFPIPTDDRLDAIFEEEVKYCYHCGAKMGGGDEDGQK